MLLWALKETNVSRSFASRLLVNMRYLPAWLSWSILSMQNTTTPLRTTLMCVMMHSRAGQMFQMIFLSFLLLVFCFSFNDEQMCCRLFPVRTQRIHSLFMSPHSSFGWCRVNWSRGRTNRFSNHTFYGNSLLIRVFISFFASRAALRNLSISLLFVSVLKQETFTMELNTYTKWLELSSELFLFVFVILYCFCL